MSMNLSPQLKSHGDELFAGEPFLLHQFFDRAARQSPERTALEIPPGSGRPERRLVSYAELERQSDNLAGFLRTFVTGECVAAILLPRNTEHLYVSQLGVLKAGAAYTCLDPTFPDEQARDILDDSEAVVLLTDSAGLTRARRSRWQCCLRLTRSPTQRESCWLTERERKPKLYFQSLSIRDTIEHNAHRCRCN